MIDIDKYERTTPELEEFEGENLGDLLTNLLVEVKRLRGIIDYIRDTGRMEKACFPNIPSGHLLSIMEKVLTTEEYLEWRNQND
tara:strand:+ start:454 stop:705 length:252 start_codon:yes stop_codon:yes gene_type:complete